MSYNIRRLIRTYFFRYFLCFLAYMLIFANFDQLVHFDIRAIMVVPLLISLHLFRKFVVEAFKLCLNRHRRWTPSKRMLFMVDKSFDLGIFLVTALPLYWAFVSTDLTTLSAVALLYHSCTLCFYMLNISQMTLARSSNINRCFYRRGPNQFHIKNPIKPKDLRPWPLELCCACNLRPASAIYLNCGHMVLCRPCTKRFRKKRMHSKCLVCGEPIGNRCFTEGSLADLLEEELKLNNPDVTEAYSTHSHSFVITPDNSSDESD
jgi:hypothetical protein